jgi:hypothetical protein
MRKYLLIAILLLLSLSSLTVVAQQQSQIAQQEAEIIIESPVISLLTCSPGSELYSAWGHSALRVRYPELGADMVFNFGIFDFSTPNFYVKFVRGKLRYMLGIQEFRDFVAIYEWEGRGIVEQKLNLTPDQKNEIVSRLDYLYKPENRYYYYSFLYKNCTTELRDLIVAHTNVSDEFLNKESSETFRDLYGMYISGWVKFGVNIMLGSSIDKKVTMFQRMFLPENLPSGFSEVVMPEGNLVAWEKTIIVATQSTKSGFGISDLFRPEVICSLILILVLLSQFCFKRLETPVRRTLFAFFGFAGLFILVAMTFSEHVELRYNFNLLWMNPLFLIPAIMSGKKRRKLYLISLLCLFLSLIALVIIWLTGVQYAETGFIIIAIALTLLLIRSITRITAV